MDPYDQLKVQEDYYDKLAAKTGKKDREEEKKLRRAMIRAEKADLKAQAKIHAANEKAKANVGSRTSVAPKAPSSSQTSVRKTPSLLNTQSASKNVGGASRGFMVALNKWKDLFW